MVGKQEDGGTVTTGTSASACTTAISSSTTNDLLDTRRCSAALPPPDEQQPGPSTPVISTKDEVIVETSDGGLFLLSRCRLAAESHFFRALFHGTYLESKSSRVRTAVLNLKTLVSSDLIVEVGEAFPAQVKL
ncbi:unnamed protein product [Cylicocyclus nassatus]|uniref:BTB domain-containing protein n=1 Tax=Cylicocyclus nassatus TaxID=53992 RepID=A0AA36M433_CYLNA|nr:unnamed protein product [Cylicocyclus nassatus]